MAGNFLAATGTEGNAGVAESDFRALPFSSANATVASAVPPLSKPVPDGLGDDSRLVELAKGGDLPAFRGLVERYERRVYPLAFSLTGNHTDAEDVLQDAFLKAFRSLALFREQSSFYTWLYRIVCNVAIDRARKRKRRGEVQIVVGNEGGLGFLESFGSGVGSTADTYMSKVSRPDEVFSNSELRDQIGAALSALTPEHRAVIMLREIDGLSYEEISETVGCSKGTVMSRLHHARKRLQKMLVDFMPSARSARDGLVEDRMREDFITEDADEASNAREPVATGKKSSR